MCLLLLHDAPEHQGSNSLHGDIQYERLAEKAQGATEQVVPHVPFLAGWDRETACISTMREDSWQLILAAFEV